MILSKKFLTWIFLKNTPTCSRGPIVYQKNKNNLVGVFEIDENLQKCRNFSLMERLLKAAELVHQYLLHVKYLNFYNFFDLYLFSKFLRTFDSHILIYRPHSYKLTKSPSGGIWSSIFSGRLKIVGLDRPSFDRTKNVR